jgi:hypothetical protein
MNSEKYGLIFNSGKDQKRNYNDFINNMLMFI